MKNISDEDPELAEKKRRFLFHLKLLLKPHRQPSGSQKTNTLRGLGYLFRFRKSSPDGIKKSRFKFVFRKPDFGKLFHSIRNSFHAITLLVRRRHTRTEDRTPSGPNPLTMSLKRLGQTGKAGIQEDLDLVRKFLGIAFRLPNKIEEPAQSGGTLRIIGPRHKDPSPRAHIFREFFHQPKRTSLLLLSETWNLIVYCSHYWKEATVAVVVFVFSVEFSVQITSTAVWALAQPHQTGFAVNQKVALFLGDSFTSGEFGARNPKPYTSFLPSIFAQKGLADWNFISYSSQHLDTSILMDVLPTLVLKERPRFVYFMIGADDLLSGTSPKAQPPTRKAVHDIAQEWFVTPRLIRNWQKDRSLSGILESFTSPPFYVRRLVQANESLQGITKEKIQSFLTHPIQTNLPPPSNYYLDGIPARWDGQRMTLSNQTQWICPNPGKYCYSASDAKDVRLLQFKNSDFILSGSRLEDYLIFHLKKTQETRSPRTTQLAPYAWQSLHAGAYDAARQLFLECLKGDGDDPTLHAGLAQTTYYLGDYTTLKNESNWLYSRFTNNPDLLTSHALIAVYPTIHSPGEVIQLGFKMLKNNPDNPWLWGTIADAFFELQDPTFANLAIQKGLTVTPQELKSVRASLLLKQSRLLFNSDLQAASRSLVQAFQLDGDSESFQKEFRDSAYIYSQEPDLQKVLKEIPLSDGERTEISRAFEDLSSPRVQKLNSLRKKLTELVDICRQSNIEPVLVTYPVPQSQINEITKTIADHTGAAWLNLNGAFEVLLQKENRNQELMKYGVLTDEANRRIAELIANDLVNRTK